VIFIFKYVLLDFIIGPINTIYQIKGFEQNNWSKANLHMKNIETAFYVFTFLKYMFLIMIVLMEHKFHHLHTRIQNLTRRPDWEEIVASILFIPLIIIDGFCINAEHTIGQNGNVFHYDSIILVLIDSALWYKTVMIMVLDNDSRDGKYQYDLIAVTLSMLTILYTLLLIYVLIIIQLKNIPKVGMGMTENSYIVLLSMLTHPYVSSYTSMVSSSIVALDKAFRKNANLRLQQIKNYIYYSARIPSSFYSTASFTSSLFINTL